MSMVQPRSNRFGRWNSFPLLPALEDLRSLDHVALFCLSLGFLALTPIAAYAGFTAPNSGARNSTMRRLENPPFDMFVLQVYWWPGHCAVGSGENSDIPLCDRSKMPEEWTQGIIVHGLWPSASNGEDPDGYKHDCEGAEYAPPSDLESGSPVTNYFPTQTEEQAAGTPQTREAQLVFPGRGVSNTNPDFYRHEYSKHGRCSGMTQADYFAESVRLGSEINERLVDIEFTAAPLAMTTLRSAIGYNPAIACDGKGQKVKALWFINFCYWRNEDGSVGEEAMCPTLQKGKQCADNEKTATVSMSL